MKVLFVGPISPPVSGPGVKNKMMKDWLNNKKPFYTIFLNTYDLKRKSIFNLFKFLKKILNVKHVILSVSKNGRFTLIPIMYIFGNKVYLFPAGGNFDDEINNLQGFKKKLFLKALSCVQTIYPETPQLYNGLLKLGLRNVQYFPNPRADGKYRVTNNINPLVFKIVFLSKIKKSKGPILLINALEKIRNKYPQIRIQLDFYGVIEDSFYDEFKENLLKNSDNKYKNIVSPDNVQKVLSKYDSFILPTYYKGEGVPGAIVEAMMTGIPIITTDFRGSNKIIEHNEDGLIIPQKDEDALSNAISTLIENPSLREKLSQNIVNKSKNYNIDALMPILIEDLDGV